MNTYFEPFTQQHEYECVVEEIEIDYCPIWSTDELTHFQELEVAASGYKHESQVCLTDIDFFDFLDERVYSQHFDRNYHPAGALFKDRKANRNVYDGQKVHGGKDWWVKESGASAQPVGRGVRGFKQPKKFKDRSPTNQISEPTSPTSLKKRKRESSEHAGPEKKRKRNFSAEGQTTCCLNNCDMSVTNRLRFSLRCTKESDFKQDFISRGWDRVCHKCYFSYLYRYKKQNRPNDKKKRKENLP